MSDAEPAHFIRQERRPSAAFRTATPPEFTALWGELARALLKHRASMGLGDASDEWIIAHVDDIAAVAIALMRHAMDIDERP